MAVGLDPGIGVLHADQPSRDSFALDLLEPTRPEVDEWVLKLLAKHRFKATDFSDTRRGICRLKPAITHWFAETSSEWATALAPHAEHSAQLLANTDGVRIDRIPTPLTGTNRSSARPNRQRRKRAKTTVPSHCYSCGRETKGRRTQCDACLPETEARHVADMVEKAHARLRHLRDAGVDPAHGGAQADQRGARNREHHKAVAEWNQSNEVADPNTFTQEILPLLSEVPLSAMATATGLTKGYCSFIKRGIKTPHQRHWNKLRLLGKWTRLNGTK